MTDKDDIAAGLAELVVLGEYQRIGDEAMITLIRSALKNGATWDEIAETILAGRADGH